jgi:hypothetical protein
MFVHYSDLVIESFSKNFACQAACREIFQVGISYSTMVEAGKNVQALVVMDTGAGTVPPALTIVLLYSVMSTPYRDISSPHMVYGSN